MKNNKYIYGYKILVNYGHGYEYECFEYTWREAKQTLKDYRENCPQYACKVTGGRELNPNYKPKDNHDNK